MPLRFLALYPHIAAVRPFPHRRLFLIVRLYRLAPFTICAGAYDPPQNLISSGRAMKAHKIFWDRQLLSEDEVRKYFPRYLFSIVPEQPGCGLPFQLHDVPVYGGHIIRHPLSVRFLGIGLCIAFLCGMKESNPLLHRLRSDRPAGFAPYSNAANCQSFPAATDFHAHRSVRNSGTFCARGQVFPDDLAHPKSMKNSFLQSLSRAHAGQTWRRNKG